MQEYCVISWLQNHTLRQQNWFNANIHLNLYGRLTASEEVWGSCENSLACQWKRREPMKDLMKSINSAVKTQPYPSFRAISLISQWVYGHCLSLSGLGKFAVCHTANIDLYWYFSPLHGFFLQIRVLNSKAVCKGCTWWSAVCCLKTAAIWGISGSFHTWISRHTLCHWLPYHCAFALHHWQHQGAVYCATCCITVWSSINICTLPLTTGGLRAFHCQCVTGYGLLV